MPKENLRVFVVSHDPEFLAKLPKRDFLEPILLGELALPEKFAGNQLAENRFLLTNILTENYFAQVGFVSARWNERFPTWPKLERLDQFLELRGEANKLYFAPQTILATGRQVNNWIKAQDAVHPGMSNLLLDVLEKLSSNNLGDPAIRGISMGNNFVVSHEVATELLEFWQRGFNYLFEKYGFDLPFEYRCASCGIVSHQGVGRWDRSRHAGFLFERLTALYFATRTDLIPIEPHGQGNRKVRRSLMAHGFTVGPLIYRWYKTFMRFGKPCQHEHEALGKKKL